MNLVGVGAEPVNRSTTASGIGLGDVVPASIAIIDEPSQVFFIEDSVFKAVNKRVVYIDAKRVSVFEGILSVRDTKEQVWGMIGEPSLAFTDRLICPEHSLIYAYYSSRRLGIGFVDDIVGKIEVMDQDAWLSKYQTAGISAPINL